MDLKIHNIPAVHNYYSDMLISFANFFDNTVFGSDTIKHYQFNIGNKTIQLNYKTQQSFPSIIINFQNSEMFQFHDWFLHRPTTLKNQLQIPILYNSTKDLTLLIQEAMYTHDITITLNCESIMQLLELKHKIEYYLPINKYIEAFNYYTFINIPQYYLNPLMFNVNHDKIYNLYCKRDSLTDKMEYMASVKYDPILKMLSCVPLGLDTDNKSFSLEMQFTMMNYIPLYFEIPPHEIPILHKKINEFSIKKICIPLSSQIPIIYLHYRDFIDNKTKHKYLPLLNIQEDNTFKTEFIDNNINYILTGQISKRIEKYSGIIESNNYSYPVSVKIIEKHEKLLILLSGAVIGYIIDPKYDKNSGIITGKFKGKFNPRNYSKKYIICDDVVITLNLFTSFIIYSINNIKLDNKNDLPSQDDVNLIYEAIPYGIMTLYHSGYNDNNLFFLPEFSKISGIGFYNTDNKLFSIKQEDSNIYPNSIINSVFEISTDNRIEHHSVSGFIDEYTLNYSIDAVQSECESSTYLMYLLIDGQFINTPKFGSSYIDRISFDIGVEPDKKTDTYLTSCTKIFADFAIIDDSENVLLSIIIPNTSQHVFFDCDYAYINLSTYSDFKNINIDNLNWVLIFRNRNFTNFNSDFKLVAVFKEPFFSCIALKIPLLIYKNNFTRYEQNINDIFYLKLFNKLEAHI